MTDNRIQRIKKISKAVFVGLTIQNMLLLFAIIWNIVECARQNWDAPRQDIAKAFALMILLFGVLLISAYIFYKINKAGTPFLAEIVKAMKAVALMVVFLVTVPDRVYQLAANMGMGLFGPNDLTALLCGGIVFCFALVFEYGCLLQTENDETF